MPLLLLADDEQAIRDAIKLSLMGTEFIIKEANSLDEIESRLKSYKVDVMLIDVHFGNETSIQLLKNLGEQDRLPPTIVLSGAASAKEAADAISYGAYDFLEKPVSSDRLRTTLKRCIEAKNLATKVKSLEKPTSSSGGQLIGESTAIKSLKSKIDQFAHTDVKVLITGETGTGKEVVAHSLWKNSKYAGKPFICVNSAAIPDELLESELFGHQKGAFTGANSDHTGKIELADGGTLFLDEVGDLSARAQTKLLRFLESDEIQPLGASDTKKVSVRLICATSKDIEEEVKKGHFREDLYYRINVARIEIPPLRERGSDVTLLAKHFMQKLTLKYEVSQKHMSAEALELMKDYSWPGNIRQLKNTCERLILNAEGEITEKDLREIFAGVPTLNSVKSSGNLTTSPNPPKGSLDEITELIYGQVKPLKEFKKKIESLYIKKVILDCEGSVSKAARALELDRTYLHQKIKQLGLKKDT